MRPDWHAESGFTLLEVMIAFVIAAIAMSDLYVGTAGGLSATQTAAKYDEALSLARSHLAGIGRGAAISQTESSGVEGDGYEWHLRIRPTATRQLTLTDQDRANDEKPAAAVLYDVVVTESWSVAGRARQVTLATRRFGVTQSDTGP
jgi:general secretion pathway protein I